MPRPATARATTAIFFGWLSALGLAALLLAAVAAAGTRRDLLLAYYGGGMAGTASSG